MSSDPQSFLYADKRSSCIRSPVSGVLQCVLCRAEFLDKDHIRFCNPAECSHGALVLNTLFAMNTPKSIIPLSFFIVIKREKTKRKETEKEEEEEVYKEEGKRENLV